MLDGDDAVIHSGDEGSRHGSPARSDDGERRHRGDDDERRNSDRRDDNRRDDRRKRHEAPATLREGEIRGVMQLEDADVAFVLGKSGSTKNKLKRVSGAEIYIEDGGRLEIIGSEEKVNLCEEYIKLVLKQRRREPMFIPRDERRSDMTQADVPQDCVGFITGGGGKALRRTEEEWGTLMFFAKTDEEGTRGDTERLVIFGAPRDRCGALLKVMSSVEHKVPGYFLNDNRDAPREPSILDQFVTDDFKFETLLMSDTEFSYALGKQGSTRKKLARAAGAIIEYVGNCAFIVGNSEERERGMTYLKWLLSQRDPGPTQIETKDRSDVVVVPVPSEYMGQITGYRGNVLRDIEHETGTFCVSDGDRNSGNSTENIMIFSGNSRNREAAERMIQRKIRDVRDGRGARYDDRRGGDRYDDRRGGDRYDDRRRGGDRYDDRRGGDRYDDRRGGDRYDDRRYDDRRGGDRYDDRRGGDRYDDRRGGDRYDDRRGGDRYGDRDRGHGGGRDRSPLRRPDSYARDRSPPRDHHSDHRRY